MVVKGESSPWLPTPQNSAEKAANDEVETLLEKKGKKKRYHYDQEYIM